MVNEELIQEILTGVNNTITAEIEGLKSKITLRPLATKEIMELRKLEKGTSKGTLKMDLPDAKDGMRQIKKENIREKVKQLEQDIIYADIEEGKDNVILKAVSYSSEIPIEQIEKFPIKITEDIFAKVMEISNVTEKDLDMLKSFRKE
jgi:hypothetical protein